ncbi:MAG TPA: GIY-YIG nuclease family protein [Symbiobacteriaceae bacterium]|nr:GIY-YIG nuclease family protein [Symbiobacteriaceae bacterium]
MSWWVYLLECGDSTLYTGITNDVERRLAMHQAGRGARYTRGRGPLRLLWCEPWPDRASASRRELELKRLPRVAKLALISAAKTDEVGVAGTDE